MRGASGRVSALSAIPFVENRGQADPVVAFYASTFAGTVSVTHEGRIVYALPSRPRGEGGARSSLALAEAPVAGHARSEGREAR